MLLFYLDNENNTYDRCHTVEKHTFFIIRCLLVGE